MPFYSNKPVDSINWNYNCEQHNQARFYCQKQHLQDCPYGRVTMVAAAHAEHEDKSDAESSSFLDHARGYLSNAYSAVYGPLVDEDKSLAEKAVHAAKFGMALYALGRYAHECPVLRCVSKRICHLPRCAVKSVKHGIRTMVCTIKQLKEEVEEEVHEAHHDLKKFKKKVKAKVKKCEDDDKKCGDKRKKRRDSHCEEEEKKSHHDRDCSDSESEKEECKSSSESCSADKKSKEQCSCSGCADGSQSCQSSDFLSSKHS